MKYVSIFPFEVMDMIMDGVKVYMLDKAANEVYCVNGLAVTVLADAIKADAAEMRYEFWYRVGEADG